MLGRMDPNFNPSNMVVPGIGGQSFQQGLSSTAPSYMTTTNANMTGTAAPSSSQGSFLSGMFGQLGGGSTSQPQQAGIAGLQAQPLDPQQQLQQQQFASQMQQQAQQQLQQQQPQQQQPQQQGGQQFSPDPRGNMSDRDRFIEGQFQGNQDLPQAQIDAMRSQFGNTFDAQGGLPRPPKAEGPGVSNFVGASSNDIQRMLNRGSVATGGVDDAQRQMEQVRTNEFLAKMRAQNPERFNNPTPPSAPSTDPRMFPTPPHNEPNLQSLAGGTPRQFPGFNSPPPPLPAPPSSGGLPSGIMGQAPGFMTQYLDMMRSPMQGSMQNPMQSYGGGGMDSNPMLQYQMPPNQSPMQTYGSQNNAPIQSPFA